VRPPKKELRGVLPRRLVVGALCAGAIGPPGAILFLPYPQPSARVAAAYPIPTMHPRFAAGEAAGQADAWYSLGGQKLLGRYYTLSEQLRALGTEAQQSVDGDALIRSRLPRICVEFGKAARDANAYFPIPDPRMQSIWWTFTTMGAASSRDCLAGLDQNDNSLVATGIRELSQAAEAQKSIIEWYQASKERRF
ncbi:hypothetical protein ACIRN5_23450, partial [Lysinibacillus fusiformis]